ncbi:MAG: ABC transporter ATP-binding protein [Actinomycetota bacterium]
MFNLDLQLASRVRAGSARIPCDLYGRSAAPVAVRGLSKSFGGARVLHGVDLDVAAGSIVALLGPSGCGKTTLLRSIAGLERPDSGRVTIGEVTVSDDDRFMLPERRRVGMVFQDWALFPHLTVEANVAFGLSRAERRSGRVEEVLEMVDLGAFGQRIPATLSGGQQQRVALARALANRPAVILLDEPFSNLDASLRVQIRSEVQKVLSDLGVTTLFVTHDQEEAFSVGEAVAVMFDGTIVQEATPAQLYEAPASRSVAAFIGDANFLQGHATGDRAETPLGVIPLSSSVAGDVDVMVRPEEVLLAPGEDAVIESVEFYGHDAVYLLRRHLDGMTFRSRTLAAPEFRPGDQVAIKYSGKCTVAFPVVA